MIITIMMMIIIIIVMTIIIKIITIAITIVIMFVFLERISIKYLLSCTEQVQIPKYKTHAKRHMQKDTPNSMCPDNYAQTSN